MGFRRKIQESPRIELTPMIDVVFLLLIFFMISTTFIERPGVAIDLPEGGTRIEATEVEDVQIYLTEDGDIYLKQELITRDALKAHLDSFGQQAKSSTFLLMADKAAQHGWVVELMEIARGAGFVKFAIATDRQVDATTIRNEQSKQQ